MLTEKDYCDYGTCVALEEIGCSYLSNDKVYVGKGGLYCKCTPPYNSQKYNEGELLSSFYILGCYKEVGTTIPAIPLYEAQKWLREERGILLQPTYLELSDEWICVIRDKNKRHGYSAQKQKNYEEALSEGLRAAVKILKNNGKAN